jgi:hypothetical protein
MNDQKQSAWREYSPNAVWHTTRKMKTHDRMSIFSSDDKLEVRPALETGGRVDGNLGFKESCS